MIRPLQTHDIAGINFLSPVAWKFDYEDFLHQFLDDDFFSAFVQIENEQIVGTGNVIIKDKVGWLANIIVDAPHRGKGLGAQMTKFLIDFLWDQGCKTQILIATEQGEPIYQKYGFEKITDYHCYDSVVDTDYTPPDAIRPLEASDINRVIKLDQTINGENRIHLISKFYNNAVGYFSDSDDLLGCYLPDFGRGCVIAQSPQVGIPLLQMKHAQKGRRTMLPIDNQAGIDWFEKMEMKKGAPCSKMILGKKNHWYPAMVYSYASGYCG